MAIKIKVQPKIATIKVSSSTNGGGLQISNPVMVSTTVANIKGRYDALADVDEGQVPPVAGAVGVYNPENDKYEVKKLDFDNLVGDIDDIDGGTF